MAEQRAGPPSGEPLLESAGCCGVIARMVAAGALVAALATLGLLLLTQPPDRWQGIADASAHPLAAQEYVYDLFSGSWIDPWDSSSGVDLDTWIGQEPKSRGWAYWAPRATPSWQAAPCPRPHLRSFRRSTRRKAETGSGGWATITPPATMRNLTTCFASTCKR